MSVREAVVSVLIENTYSDDHRSVETVTVPAPDPAAPDLEDWWEEAVFPHTGDGHGIGRPDLGSHHTATITEAEDATLVGLDHEWED